MPRSLSANFISLLSSSTAYSSVHFNLSDITAAVSNHEIIHTLNRIIKYDNKLTQSQQNFLYTLISIHQLALQDAAETVVKQYCQDVSAKYNLSFNHSSPLALLQPNSQCCQYAFICYQNISLYNSQHQTAISVSSFSIYLSAQH